MGEGSASRPGRSLHPVRTRYSLYRRLGGPQGRSGQVRKVSPPTGIRSPDRPGRTSRYTDWDTRSTKLIQGRNLKKCHFWVFEIILAVVLLLSCYLPKSAGHIARVEIENIRRNEVYAIVWQITGSITLLVITSDKTHTHTHTHTLVCVYRLLVFTEYWNEGMMVRQY